MIDRYSRSEMRAVWSDENRFTLYLAVELAALRAQARRRGVPKAEVERFAKAAARFSVARIRAREKVLAHEMEAFIEEVLAKGRRYPKAARLFHFGMTSFDAQDTAMGLQLKAAAALLEAGWQRVLAAEAALAKRHAGTWMAGRSHGIHAEPITFGFKVAGWYAEGARNLARLRRAAKDAAYGKISGAVGNFSTLEPAVEAEALRALGLGIEPASTQVIPRDRHADFIAVLAMSAAAIERVALEVRHLQRTEVGELSEPFGRGQKGSSAMPHKKNPVLSENLCGLARLVRHHAGAAFENIALWNERDISHSSVERVALIDSCILVDFMLHRLAGMLEGLQVYPERMQRNLELTGGGVFSGKVLLALIEAGLDRVSAYAIVQRCAFAARERGEPLQEALAADAEARKALGARGLKACFELAPYGRHVPAILRRAGIR